MPPTDQQIVESYRRLKNQKKVASELGCSQSHVSTALQRSGIRIGRGTKQRKIQDDSQVLALWNEHQSTAIVAEILDVTQGNISRILRDKFDVHVPIGVYNKYDLPMDELAERYHAGETCGDIARSLGLSSERIRRRLKKHGVKIRSAAESVPRGPKNIFYKDGSGSSYQENKYQSKKVAAAYLGRELPEGWVVHHQDEDPENLDLENLYLFPSLSAHAAYHTQLLSLQHRGLATDAIQMVLENGGLPLLQHPLRVKS